MTGVTKEDRVTEKLFSGLLCSCKNTVQADIGKLSGELFNRVDTEGQSIEVAAEALGLGTRDARTLLFMFRKRMASALVGSISAAHPARGPRPN